jgi:uncharacterized protein (TIGR00251 family)
VDLILRERDGEIEFTVRATPRAARSEIAGVQDGALLVRLNAPPVEGAANRAVLELLAEVLAVPRRSMRLVSGARSRLKRVTVCGLPREVLSARLHAALPKETTRTTG